MSEMLYSFLAIIAAASNHCCGAVEADAADKGNGRLLNYCSEFLVKACALHTKVGGELLHTVLRIREMLFYERCRPRHKFFFLCRGFGCCWFLCCGFGRGFCAWHVRFFMSFFDYNYAYCREQQRVKQICNFGLPPR